MRTDISSKPTRQRQQNLRESKDVDKEWPAHQDHAPGATSRESANFKRCLFTRSSSSPRLRSSPSPPSDKSRYAVVLRDQTTKRQTEGHLWTDMEVGSGDSRCRHHTCVPDVTKATFRRGIHYVPSPQAQHTDSALSWKINLSTTDANPTTKTIRQVVWVHLKAGVVLVDPGRSAALLAANSHNRAARSGVVSGGATHIGVAFEICNATERRKKKSAHRTGRVITCVTR